MCCGFINGVEGTLSRDSHAAAVSVRVGVIALLLMHASLSLNPLVSLWNWTDLMLLSCWINFFAPFGSFLRRFLRTTVPPKF